MRDVLPLFVAVLAACARDRSSAKRVVEEERGDATKTSVQPPPPACDPPCEASTCFAGACVVEANTATTPHEATCAEGKRRAYHCSAPIGFSSIWGNDRYTDDSAVCTAAVHAGVLDATKGGDVAIEMRRGLAAYPSVARNGVTSGAWAAWPCSYVFVGGACTSCGDECVDAKTDEMNCGACGHRCAAGDACIGGLCVVPPLSWSANAKVWACDVGATHVVDCPSGTLASGASVWGTDVYTNDSSICYAAVHAGKIGISSGGRVTLEMIAGQKSYAGSFRNGVTTMSYGPWPCSYRFK